MKTKVKTPVTEAEIRAEYVKAFGREFDDPKRMQPPLPLDIACLVAMYVNENENNITYI